MRLLAFLFVALVTGGGHANAQAFVPCPQFTIGWSKQYAGSPITSVMYDSQSQLLYVIWNNTIPSAFSNVPTTVMTGLSSARDPVVYYNSAIYPVYHSLLLAQTNNCPMLFETGAYIWTK